MEVGNINSKLDVIRKIGSDFTNSSDSRSNNPFANKLTNLIASHPDRYQNDCKNYIKEL